MLRCQDWQAYQIGSWDHRHKELIFKLQLFLLRAVKQKELISTSSQSALDLDKAVKGGELIHRQTSLRLQMLGQQTLLVVDVPLLFSI